METLTDKKTVFYSKLSGQFDTPKKLNRSAKQVPQAFINKIEAGQIDSADIKDIEKSFPVFTYQSCITIHGALPEIEIQRIGGYKNIIQNKNGSLEIRWSAIDFQAKDNIRKLLRHSAQWRSHENSTSGIYFEQINITDNKEEAYKLLAIKRAEVENMDIKGLTAKIFVEGFAYFGRYYISICILPYSITEKPLFIASQITGMSEAELIEKQKEADDKNKQYEAQRNEAIANREEALKQAESKLIDYKKVAISGNIGSVYVSPTITVKNEPAFRFYKVVSKGTFGRVIAETYLSSQPIFEPEKLQPYMKGKQVKPSEITARAIYLVNN